MSRMKRSGAQVAAEKSPLPKKLLKEVIAVYVFFMFAIYPLYYEEKYYNMGDAKWHFFRWVTLVALILLLGLFVWYQIYLAGKDKLKEYWDFKKTTILDRFVLAYAIACLLSYLFSPYKDTILYGYDGWYMGLIAQIAFVLLYYFSSRFWRWDEICLTIYLAVSAVVFLLCILHRFRVDPMQMYVGLDEGYIINFISTLGQATWFSSYMVIIFPIGLFAYWHYDKPQIRVPAGIYVALSCMTMITQNSDSAFAAYFAILVGLFCYSFRDNRLMKRFFEVLVIMFASWKFIGILQTIFADRAVELSETMMGMSKGNLTWFMLLISVLAYAAFYFLDKNGKIDITKLKWIRTVVLSLIGAGTALIVVYVTLNTKGVFAGTALESDHNYLVFDTYWGNNRGSSWIITVQTFFDCDFMRKLFGAGPDGFFNLAYLYHGQELVEKWGENTILTCAHNEWMTAIINVGLVGGIAYIGIFISAMVHFTKKVQEIPEAAAPVLCILGYMLHNFFCYQQIICTPIIFLIMGIGECLVRYGKRPIWEEDGD
ncbi:MAG: hypothetical protein K6F35_12870 [Lachnospiraceae bacterium]|nr:hypothetical protein [Lachnospiraceae bacterium]